MKTTQTQHITEGREVHDFMLRDNKDRSVGAQVAFSVKVYEQIAEDVRTWSPVAPGTYYCWAGWAMRGGEIYGALQPWHHCATEAERFAAVAKYLKGAKARARKQFPARP